ncbi:zinc metalloprotease [Paenibacillus swuensis]|uniref:Zinc metalloprotease n=1 Tax=Paenibacillus swuensis TaxID=1178515 RepID=A0A172TKF3_9BACL|nr:site-2 protease family protein [Paenibacillus swuensis]ANE47297.1 zinc metalloprotease [Paenibacillus swuensis]
MDSANFFRFPIEEWPFVLLSLAIGLSVHEFAHAYTAWKFGDPTAKDRGRVTLNPMAHLDIFGTILIFIAGFGWAKPVPVNRSYFKKPRMMSIFVSLAGPVSNLLIVFIGLFLFYLLDYLGAIENLSTGSITALVTFFKYLISLNITLFLFNLIPLPPLDGYRIIEDLAPQPIRAKMSQYEHWGAFIFLLLVFIPPLSRVTIVPLFSLSDHILLLFGNIIGSIFGM